MWYISGCDGVGGRCFGVPRLFVLKRVEVGDIDEDDK
jgi:hypothetical protein